MAPVDRWINYLTLPEKQTKINGNKIARLRELLKDFEYRIIQKNYNFTYKNIEITISIDSVILISLSSSTNTTYGSSLLTKLADNINSIIEVEKFSGNIIS